VTLTLKARRQKRICKKKLRYVSLKAVCPFFSLVVDRFAQETDPVLFLFLSLRQSIETNVEFNICNHMKISLEYSPGKVELGNVCLVVFLRGFNLQCHVFSVRMYISEKNWGTDSEGN
jgi:hypothetical protein